VASTGATGQHEPIATRPARPRRRSVGTEGQGSLF
jgi:hypothetical protein